MPDLGSGGFAGSSPVAPSMAVCSSVWLERMSGGHEVESSNLSTQIKLFLFVVE